MKKAGVDRPAVVAEVSERNRRAAQARNAKVEKDRAEARDRTLNRLIKVADGALVREMELLAKGEFTRDDLQALTNARQKAIQQIELLEGRATSRVETNEEIQFAVAAMVSCFNRAMERALELGVSERIEDEIRSRFAFEIRMVEDRREEIMLELEAGDIEDAEADEL
jgi:hypothetical protein